MTDHEHVWGIRHHIAGTAYVQQCVSLDCQATREGGTSGDDEAVQDAIRTVARDLIDKVVVAARDTDDMWEWYPEIGEHDWERVTDHVEAYLSVNLRVPSEPFDAAYALLANRANATPEPGR